MHPGKRPRITRIATLKRPIKTGMAHPARMEKAHPAGKTIAVAGLAARINGVWVEEGGRTEMLRVQMKANNGFLKVYAKNLPTQKGTFRQVFRDMILVQPGNQVYVVQMSPDRMDWSSPDGKERRRFFRNRLPERDAFARWKSGRAKPFFIRGENPKVQGDLPPRFGRE